MSTLEQLLQDDEALRAAACFNEGIKTCLGLDVKPIKRMVYSPSVVTRAELRRRDVTLGIVRADGSWIRRADGLGRRMSAVRCRLVTLSGVRCGPGLLRT